MFKIKHLIRKKKKHLLKFFKITKNVVMFFFDNFSLVNILSSTHKKNDSKIHSFSFMASYILSIKKMIAKFILLVFFHCCTPVGVWRAAGLWQVIEPLLHRFDDAPDIIFQVLQNVTAAQAELFATVLWSIWKSRNLKLWQQENENNSNIIERAKHLLEGWRIANMKQ
jgi:hypothetical protein